MILADKIIELRKKNGWSQEDLAEQLHVSRQSVSKWEGAQSIPDMNKIIAMSNLFGVSTDVLLKDELSLEDGTSQEVVASVEQRDGEGELPIKAISMEDANTYLKENTEFARPIACGVSLCILSPVLLIILGGFSEYGVIPLSEMQAAGIGLVVLFLLIMGAVALFVIHGMKHSRWDYLEKSFLDTAYGVDGMVRERREKYRSRFMTELVSGIAICIGSLIPMGVILVIFGDKGRSAEVAMVACVGCMLVLLALGVHLIIHASIVWSGFQQLLEEGDYTRENKAFNATPWMTGYWIFVTAVYLGVSFLTERWDLTWIIWLVAVAVCTILAGVFGKKNKNA
ncbi:MAG: helix-turn-helix domain-containing protein [Lachnospiraceae bacterium]|nr:helix-turn-helix domain-containing protein [Lachnospiraceae bacterium]